MGPRATDKRSVRVALGATCPLIENAAADTCRNIRHELDRMHLVTLATDDGQVAQRSLTTTGHAKILTALEPPEPPRLFDSTSTGASDSHDHPNDS